MISKKEFDWLAGRRIKLVVVGVWSDGPYEQELTYSDLLEIAKDKEGWLAKQAGVSLEHYRKWQKHLADEDQCTALTKKGKRCRQRSYPGALPGPKSFVEGISDRCVNHRELSGGRS